MKQTDEIRLALSRAGIIAASACLAGILLVGCSAGTRQKILSILFDGVSQTPPPPTRRVRRDLLREIEELKRELSEAQEAAKIAQQPPPEKETQQSSESPRPIEEVKTWDEAAKFLPTTADGAPDWSKALAEGVISPKAGIGDQKFAQPILQLDVGLIPEEDPAYKVIFKHETHTAWLTCANCHSGIFKREKGADPIAMDAIYEGKYCGVCHGTVAFPADACNRCHLEIGGE